MTPGELREVFERLARGPSAATQAGRHVYLWHGDRAVLEALIPPAIRQCMDLYQLAQQLPRTPYAIDEARRLLRGQLERELRAQAGRASRQALVVGGVSLLARYGVPLQPFYAFAGDSRAVVLLVSREDSEFELTTGLPDFVRFNPPATLTVLSRAIGDNGVIQG